MPHIFFAVFVVVRLLGWTGVSLSNPSHLGKIDHENDNLQIYSRYVLCDRQIPPVGQLINEDGHTEIKKSPCVVETAGGEKARVMCYFIEPPQLKLSL